MDKHRFLVQSKVIEDSTYERLLALDPSARAEELTKIWDGPKDDRKNIKLKVEFKYSTHTSSHTTSARSHSSETELRSGLARNDEPAGNATPELVVSELQAMRKKYDAVVEYTVHLTAERDAIVAQLDNLQRELSKEKAKKKGEVGTKTVTADKIEKKAVEKVRTSFLPILLFVPFIALSLFFVSLQFAHPNARS